MATYHDEGVVLRTYRLGEADRIVVFLTKNHGKVRAVAKGVRKTKSRLGSRVEPLSHVTLLCWRGRELDIVSQAEVIDSFRAIRDDFGRIGSALAMLEIIDQVALEDHASPELFALLVGALRFLESSSSPLVLGAFCLKLLRLEGVEPITNVCAGCGADGPLVAFDAREGGFLCARCRRGDAVSAEVVELVQSVLTGSLGRVLAAPVPPSFVAFERLAIRAVECHLDRQLRSTRHLLEFEQRGA
jgi:DNA repair protein RecO (recombination protein O)